VKTRRITWIAIILLTAVSLGSSLGYRSWARRAKTPRIVVERDQSDITSFFGTQTGNCYDPYFNRVNFFNAGIVASHTNVLSGSNTGK
jgi:hypothetical protein